MSTLSVTFVHAPRLSLHCKVYAEPETPLNVEVGLAAFPNEPPAPLTIVQSPDAPVGIELPANVTCVRPHVEAPTWSGPALAEMLHVFVIRISSIHTSTKLNPVETAWKPINLVIEELTVKEAVLAVP